VFWTYSGVDFGLGFNAVQMTLGTVIELADAMIIPATRPTATGSPQGFRLTEAWGTDTFGVARSGVRAVLRNWA
jgi:hypothetical protein